MKCLHLGISCLTIAATSFLYISCKREAPQVAAIDTNFSNSATVQVFNATVKSARNYIFVDGSPVSGSGLAFGAVFPASAYAIRLPAGSRSFLIRDTSSTSTQPPLNFTQTLDVGKSYTIFMYDTLTSPKQSAVVNNITIPTDTTSRLRFANFVYSSTSIPNVDVYSFRRGTAAPVFANVANGTVTDFIPYASMLTDTLYVYAAGTTSPLLVKSLVTTLTPTRSYTSTFSGSYKGTKSVTTFATY